MATRVPRWLHWPSSLWARLLLASILLMPAFLLVSGYMLDKSFSASQQAAQKAHLQSQIYLLMAAAEWDGENLWLPETLQEPGFNQPNSGLYGFIIGSQTELWRSASAQYQLRHWRPSVATNEIRPGNTGFYLQTIHIPASVATATNSESIAHNERDDTIAIALFYYDILWETSPGNDIASAADNAQPLRFYVVQDLTQSQLEQRAYRQQLSYALGTLMLTLLLLQVIIVRWGLRPLSKVSAELRAIEQGSQEQLIGNYPREIQPITTSFNLVLANEQKQRERYRTTLGDLAHSLKTPLAVMQGELHDLKPEQAQTTLADQCSRMNQIIQHQLRRAVAGQKTFAEATPIKPLVERLCNALGKVYREKNITFEQHIPGICPFYGASSDFMEVMGNILDNACKFCQARISVTAQWENNVLSICIDDDGPGLAENQQQDVLKRGARADTAYAGQGIGLAVAIDIISSYQGALSIEASPLGGARFRITLHQSS